MDVKTYVGYSKIYKKILRSLSTLSFENYNPVNQLMEERTDYVLIRVIETKIARQRIKIYMIDYH